MDSSKLSNPYKVPVKGNVSSRSSTVPPAPPFMELPSESCENNSKNDINNTNTVRHCQQIVGHYSPLRPANSVHNSLNSTLGTEVVNPYKKPQHRIESNNGQNVANPYQRKRRISFSTPLVPTKNNTAMQPKPKIRNPYLKKAGMTSNTSHQHQTLSVTSSVVQTPAKRRQYESTDQQEPITNLVSNEHGDNQSVVQNQEMPLVNSQTKQKHASFDYGKSGNHESPTNPLALAKTNGRKHSISSDSVQAHVSTSNNEKAPLSNQRSTTCSRFISSKNPFLRTRFTPDHNSTLVTPTRSPSVKSPCRELRQTTVTFLIGAMKKAKDDFLVQQSNSLYDEIPHSPQPQYVQIYGIAVSEPISTLYKSQESLAFCLDDGTATIDVLYVDPTDVNHNGNQKRFKDNFLSSLNLQPKRIVTKGARIECRGCIRFFPSDHQDSDGIQPKLTPCYIVDSIAFATDPNFEALRTAQISYLKKNPGFAKGGSAVPQKLEDKMYVLGNPEKVYRSEDNAESSVDRHRLFHMISLSKPKGLSYDELGLLLSVQSLEEAHVLQNELKVLQDSFEIYVSREGAFLPM